MRLPAGVPARLVVTDLYSRATTWTAKTLLQAGVNANLNAPWQITADVRSGDQAVNTIFPTDSDPVIAQNNRLGFVFLREAPASMPPWVCRASGILMGLEDATDSDISTSHLTFYDPWQYLRGIPCFMDGVGTPIGSLGRQFISYAGGGAAIAAQLLADSINSLLYLSSNATINFPVMPNPGGLFIDAGTTYAGTTYWTGTIESTPVLTEFDVQQGTMLGDAWDQLCAGGQDASGTALGVDIVLEPIYDPVNRPGFTSQLSIYTRAGVCQYAAPMSWGRFGRSSTTADRVHDGTPGSFVNVARFGAGQGGTDGNAFAEVNAASTAVYYTYWAAQFFPGQPIVSQVENLAISATNLAKQGKRTFALDPDPLRSPMPFRDYTVGDRIPVYTPGVTTPNGPSQRVAATGYQRVETIPLVINSDGVTSVSKLLCSPDYRGDTSPCT
jgi:hypothetical protein